MNPRTKPIIIIAICFVCVLFGIKSYQKTHLTEKEWDIVFENAANTAKARYYQPFEINDFSFDGSSGEIHILLKSGSDTATADFVIKNRGNNILEGCQTQTNFTPDNSSDSYNPKVLSKTHMEKLILVYENDIEIMRILTETSEKALEYENDSEGLMQFYLSPELKGSLSEIENKTNSFYKQFKNLYPEPPSVYSSPSIESDYNFFKSVSDKDYDLKEGYPQTDTLPRVREIYNGNKTLISVLEEEMAFFKSELQTLGES